MERSSCRDWELPVLPGVALRFAWSSLAFTHLGLELLLAQVDATLLKCLESDPPGNLAHCARLVALRAANCWAHNVAPSTPSCADSAMELVIDHALHLLFKASTGFQVQIKTPKPHMVWVLDSFQIAFPFHHGSGELHFKLSAGLSTL